MDIEQALRSYALACLICSLAAGCQDRSAAEPVLKASRPRLDSDQTVRLSGGYRRSSLVSTEKIHRRSFRETVDVLGEVAPEPDEAIQVRAKTSGRINALSVALGDMVAEGQVLARYDEDGSGKLLDITAPRAGVIVGAYAEPGGHVEPAVPLMTLGETARLRCILDIYEKDIGKVRKGQKVRITSPTFPKDAFDGSITYISPRVSENTRTFKARADIDNRAGKLRFGMFVEGRIVVGERQAFIVPETSVLTLEGKPYVFASSDGESFSLREISVAPGAGDQGVEIFSGLREGESLVTRGGFMLLAESAKPKD